MEKLRTVLVIVGKFKIIYIDSAALQNYGKMAEWFKAAGVWIICCIRDR
jgi:hypothetical protein